jgi:hypothetical protein
LTRKKDWFKPLTIGIGGNNQKDFSGADVNPLCNHDRECGQPHLFPNNWEDLSSPTTEGTALQQRNIQK